MQSRKEELERIDGSESFKDTVKALVERLDKMEEHNKEMYKRYKEHDQTIKTLTFNVSGFGHDDETPSRSPSPDPSNKSSSQSQQQQQPSITEQIQVEKTGEILELEQKKVAHAKRVTVMLSKVRETAKMSAMLREEAKKKKLEQDHEHRRIREMKEQHARASTKEMVTDDQNKFKLEMLEMEKTIAAMQKKFEETEERNRIELERREREAQDKMKKIEAEVLAAKDTVEQTEREMKVKNEQAMMEALKEKAAGGEDDLAMRALRAAEARSRMTPEQRERAKRRWKLALHKVLSPAAVIKRAMGNFGKEKVSKSHTVVSRVEKIEKEAGVMDSRLHQVEKLLKKQKAQLLRDERSKILMQEEVRLLRAKGARMSALCKELTEAMVGTNMQIAIEKYNALEGLAEQDGGVGGVIAPLKPGDASHRDAVCGSLESASKSEALTASKAFKGKLQALWEKLRRPQAEDFVPLMVARDIIDLLQDHDEELDLMRHDAGVSEGATDSKPFDVHTSDSEDREYSSSEVEKLQMAKSDIMSQPRHISLKDMLRLELHRIVSNAATSASQEGVEKRLRDLSVFMQAELDRLDAANRELVRSTEMKISGVLRKTNDLEMNRENEFNSTLGNIHAMEDKVADVKSLLDMKAEKDRVNLIDGAIGHVREDLSAIRKKLPGRDITDSLSSIKKKVEGKADKRDIKKMMRTLDAKKSDPAIGKRCLSCDRPLSAGGQLTSYSPQVEVPASMRPGYSSPIVGNWRANTEQVYVKSSYSKATSPYKSMTGMRPRSAHARTRGGGKVEKARSRSNDNNRADALRFGIEKPLHIALFENDRVKRVAGNDSKRQERDMLGQWESGGASPEVHRLEDLGQ